MNQERRVLDLLAAVNGYSVDDTGADTFDVRRKNDYGPQVARETADQARRITMLTAFLAAAALVVSAAAAYFGGTLGGNHRDKQTVVVGWYRPW